MQTDHEVMMSEMKRWRPSSFAETTIDRDREFDQTAKTEPTAADFARPMPEVITRQQQSTPFEPQTDDFTLGPQAAAFIKELQDELREERRSHGETTAKLAAAELRIQQFEKFAQNLAEKIDEMNADCIFLTGKSFDEHLADLNRERATLRETGATSSLCREDLGGGMVCLLDTGHDGLCNANPQPPHVAELDVTKPCDFVRKDDSIFSFGKCRLLSGHSGPHVY